MVARFRGAQRNLTTIVAHAPHGKASSDDRTNFYTACSDTLSACNEMDTKVVLIDANTGPGSWRAGREYIVGPYGIPYVKKNLEKDEN